VLEEQRGLEGGGWCNGLEASSRGHFYKTQLCKASGVAPSVRNERPAEGDCKIHACMQTESKWKDWLKKLAAQHKWK